MQRRGCAAGELALDEFADSDELDSFSMRHRLCRGVEVERVLPNALARACCHRVGDNAIHLGISRG